MLVALGACSKDGNKPTPPPVEDAGPPPAPPELYQPPVRLAGPAPAATKTVGSGRSVVYPVRQPLILAPGVEPVWPPMKVQALLAIPDRRLAAASGKLAGAAGEPGGQSAGQGKGLAVEVAVELIDVENGTVLWRDTEQCSGPVVHTSTDRVVCAGWKGTVALNADSGRAVWTTPQIFRAAGNGYVVVRDASQITVGAIMDVATGRTTNRVQMPEGYDLEEVRYLCADKTGFDMYSWSPAGELRRFRLGRREEVAYLIWARRLEQEPARLDPCDPVVLVETPIPGQSARQLRALTRKKGAKLGARVAQFGWWPAMSSSAEPGDIEVVTTEGFELRDRRLGNIRARADRPIGGRSLAAWADLRMIRSVSGTALIVDEHGIRHWLGAPAHIGQAVLTPSHILAGPWLGSPHSGAENLTLYKLPEANARVDAIARTRAARDPAGAVPAIPFAEAPTAPPPPPPLTTATLKRMPKTETSAVATVAFPHPGDFEVARVALAGTELYVAVIPAGGQAVHGLGLAVFDLTRREWGWYRERACAANAEVVGIAITERAVICATRELFPGPGVLKALARETGAPLWTRKLATLDSALGAGGTAVAVAGSRASVLDASSGEIAFEVVADNGHLPRVVLSGGAIISVESTSGRGLIVARKPDGTALWSSAVRGYVSELRPMVEAVAVHTHAGELFLIRTRDGSVRAVDGKSMQWKDSGGGDLAFDSARGRQGELIMWAYDARGKERFRASYPTIIDWVPAPLRAPVAQAPVLLMSRQPEPRLLIIDPVTGDIRARHLAPARAYRQSVFSTVVGGRPTVGMVLREGLAVQVY